MAKEEKPKIDLPSRAAVIAAVITALASIIVAIIQLNSKIQVSITNDEILSTTTVLSEQIKSGNATQTSLNETLAAPTIEVIPAFTQIQTNTPVSIATPSLPRFDDEFENGIKKDWQILIGNVGMANGNFTVIDPPSGFSTKHVAIISGYEWENLRITTTLNKLLNGFNCFELICDSNAAAGIIIRYIPGSTSIGLLLNPGGSSSNIAFGTIDENFEWSVIAQSGAYISYANPNNIIINAVGDTYTVTVNGEKISSVTIPGTTKGQVGLWFRTYNFESGQIEYFAPRFDEFMVQAIQ